jgi:hypothetical protein
VSVTKLIPEVAIHTSGFVVSSASLKVDGNVSSNGEPISGAEVNISFCDKSASTTTDNEGSFSFTLDAPLNPATMGSQSISVSVVPTEPWFDTAQAGASIFVLNFLNIGFLSIAVIATGVVLYQWRKGRSAAPPPTEELPPVAMEEKPIMEHKPGEPKERMLAAYYDVAGVVQRLTAISLESQMTLREFLRETKPLLGRAGEAFAELTYMAERALYSPYIGAEDVAKAEELAQTLKELEG